jgi:hypothetical protein
VGPDGSASEEPEPPLNPPEHWKPAGTVGVGLRGVVALGVGVGMGGVGLALGVEFEHAASMTTRTAGARVRHTAVARRPSSRII